MSDTNSSHQIRCLHTEHGRPSEDGSEFHWRCRSLFTYDDQLEPWQRDFCPYHRPLYRPSDHVMTREEAQALNRQISRLNNQVTMPDVKPEGEGLSEGERVWAEERKRELRNQAIDAGLLDREPGGEG